MPYHGGGEKHRFSSENAFAFRNAEFPDPALVFSVEEKILTYRQFFGVVTDNYVDFLLQNTPLSCILKLVVVSRIGT